MDNKELYKKAVEAVKALFNDTSVDAEQTKKSLLALVEEIDLLLEALADESLLLETL